MKIKSILISLTIILSLVSAYKVQAVTTTLSTYSVSSSFDDVNETNGHLSTVFGPFSKQLWFGNDGPGVDSWTGVRFNNINIPRGSIIDSAQLQVYSQNGQWINLRMDISGELATDSAAFSSDAVPSKRAVTSQKITHNSNAGWLGGTWNDWGEIKNIIQEIVDQPNWQAGNSLSLLAHGVGNPWGRKFVSSFDDSPNLAPRLLITLNSAQSPLVGAALGNYNPPVGDSCNINIPSQFSTIQAGINAASSGNTVCVDAGTYNEDVLINKSIRLSGRGANITIINGQDSTWPGAVFITATNAIVEGFLIRGVGVNIAVHLDVNDLTLGSTVQYNWMKSGNGGMALQIDRFQNNTLIQNNVLEGNNSPYVARELGSTGKVDFLNNTFIGTVNPNTRSDTGITLDAGVPNSLIKQNVFNTTGTQIVLIAPNGTSVINENNFNSSVSRKVGNGWPTTVNAENNWWGDLDPSDNIQGDVDFTPFATSPFLEN